MAIKHKTKYLFMRNNGIWLFQIFVPSYMRHLTDGKRVFRRSSGERDIEKAINFRDHMIIEFNKIKNQLKPDAHQLKTQRGIAALHGLIKQQANKPQNTYAAKPSISPTLALIRDEYLSEYQDKRELTTLSKTLLSVNLFIESLGIASPTIGQDHLPGRGQSNLVPTPLPEND